MDTGESQILPAESASEAITQKKNVFSRLGKKGLALSVSLILLVAGGIGGYFYNHKLIQDQKKIFADGCFNLGLTLTEDFDDYRSGLSYPTLYFRDEQKHSKYFQSIPETINDYIFLSSQNSKFSGASESQELLDNVKEKWSQFIKIKEKKESIERSNPDAMEIRLLIRVGFSMTSMDNIYLFNPTRALELGRKADKLYLTYLNKRWTTQDKQSYEEAIDEYNASVSSLKLICGKARAGNR